MRARSGSPIRRLRDDVRLALLLAALAVARRLPRRAVALLFAGAGLIAYAVLGRARRLARARLAAGLGSPVAERRVAGAFVRAGLHLADTIALLRPDEAPDRTLALDPASRDTLRAALGEGRGVVFASAHLGAWERMAAVLAAETFPVATLARASRDPRITALYERLRAPRRVRAFYAAGAAAARAAVRELGNGRAIGLLVDLPSRSPGPTAKVSLFGASHAMPLGPAKLARRCGSAVVVGTVAPPAPRSPGHRPLPRILIDRVATSDLPGGPEGDLELAARIAGALDDRIRAWPDAWLGLFVAEPAEGSTAPVRSRGKCAT